MTDKDRADWLRERRTGVGSSDAAALMLGAGSPGVYSTPLKVYLDKLGLLPEEDSQPMRWGRLLEDVVGGAFEIETGRKVVKPRDPLYRSPQRPWMIASPDREVVGERALLECKTADVSSRQQWGPSGTDVVPDGYLVQVQHQLAVLGLERAYLAVLIGGNDFRWYCLPRHEALIEAIAGITKGFWSMVQRQEPPGEDWSHPETPRLLELLHRPNPDAPAKQLDAQALMIVDHLCALGEEIGELERERSKERSRLYRIMDEATVGHLPDGRRVERKLVTVKQHTVKESSYVRLYIKGEPNVR